MSVHHLQDMVRGWFVGNFSPTALKTEACEVAVKSYSAGDREPAHVHRIATELTLILSGRVRMNGVEYGPGAIVVVPPGEATDFEALTDTQNAVVKVPAVAGDKYLVE